IRPFRINELSPFKAYPSQTNFVLVEVGSKEKSNLVYNNLLEKGILVQTIYEPAFSTSRYFLRITVGNKKENEILIKGLQNVSKNHSLSRTDWQTGRPVDWPTDRPNYLID
ncbi:unnamed protein product, partial [marine sediment metagenome]